MWKKIALGVLIVFGLMQLYRPEKNISISNNDASDLLKVYNAPQEVQQIFIKACYDCHSNTTQGYNWYADIAPVSWWLSSHINEGKKHVNYSEFTKMDDERRDHKIEESIEALEEGWMPLKSYVWMHQEANLTDEERKLATDWLKSIR